MSRHLLIIDQFSRPYWGDDESGRARRVSNPMSGIETLTMEGGRRPRFIPPSNCSTISFPKRTSVGKEFSNHPVRAHQAKILGRL